MKRQFVNLVLENGNRSFSLHRIRSSSLFYPKKLNGRPTTPPPPPMPLLEEAALPKPALLFGLSRHKDKDHDYGEKWRFMPLGRSADKIVGIDQTANPGDVVLYDARQNMMFSLPKHKWVTYEWSYIPIAAADDTLYLIDRYQDSNPWLRQHSFQALIHGEPPNHEGRWPGWYWHTLAPPPYVDAPGYKATDDSRIISFAVVGDNIWVSAKRIGTYSFNMTSRVWSKVGRWELPFLGGTEYVPELGLWLGFSSKRENQFLCASDLSTVGCIHRKPTLCRVWRGREDLAIPEDWSVQSSDLVRVDSGRFFVARFFNVDEEETRGDSIVKERLIVLTGVEVESCSQADEGLRMIKHKSLRYNLDKIPYHWVF